MTAASYINFANNFNLSGLRKRGRSEPFRGVKHPRAFSCRAKDAIGRWRDALQNYAKRRRSRLISPRETLYSLARMVYRVTLNSNVDISGDKSGSEGERNDIWNCVSYVLCSSRYYELKEVKVHICVLNFEGWMWSMEGGMKITQKKLHFSFRVERHAKKVLGAYVMWRDWTSINTAMCLMILWYYDIQYLVFRDRPQSIIFFRATRNLINFESMSWR